MRRDDFDYYLPRELIAQRPLVPRDSSRLLILHRHRKQIEHRKFHHIIEFLKKGDLLVLNNTRVIPARLKGRKDQTGGKVEILLLKNEGKGIWECLLKPGRRVREGTEIHFPQTEIIGKVLSRNQGAGAVVKFTPSEKVEEVLTKVGEIPLPPYIKRKEGLTPQDRERYQTVYASKDGAVAAPTAGLHFTSSLLERIRNKGVGIVEVTLHTGWASFKSLPEREVEDNSIPEEYFVIRKDAATVINEVKQRGGKIVTVGTTTTRVLETQANQRGKVSPGQGWTNLFIYPGYEFKLTEALLTNFHMPKSSLILLVSAFVGKERLLSAYKEAIRQKYRFLSFGDAMLII